MITKNDLKALDLFLTKYPTWWYTIGVCDLTRDFTCGAQSHSPEMPAVEKHFVEGSDYQDFRCDHEGSIADAILDVMQQIEDKLC